MTVYVALLRGVNVGGRGKLAMADLKAAFERLGCEDVSTYIASGNVVFRDRRKASTLTRLAERELGVRVAIRDLAQMEELCASIPEEWVNDKEQKTDVIFRVDEPAQEVWHALRKDVKPGETRANDPCLTARNVNTVRKLTELMRAR